MQKLFIPYLRNIIPLSKRIYNLVYKKNKDFNVEIRTKGKQVNFSNFLTIELDLINAFFVIIDDNIYPILNNYCKVSFMLPLNSQNQIFKIKVVGFLVSKDLEISGGLFSENKINSIYFDRTGKIANKLISSIEPKISESISIASVSMNEKPSLITMNQIENPNIKLNEIKDFSINLELSNLYTNLKKQLINE